MKLQKPPSPPVPPSPEPTSGRARKDVNYVPLKPPPALPSAHTPPADEYDLVEDLATPIKAASPIADPTTGPSPPSVRDLIPPVRPEAPTAHWEPNDNGPFQTGPMQPLPPPSSRNPAFGPPSQQPMHAASSGRLQHVAPSGQGPISGPITGPHIPVMQRPPSGSTGPFPTVGQSAVPPSQVAPPDDGVPLGYVVASAFFLAIALVGFGLYLAFEVISL
ncbi:MAG: hypothetical protein KIT84_21665 [Labilithrix sp.]|nr:hypothetical protein [Labilithrix sp.]MCW5813652.1 hypothetical protein [Labilithrix sp.]